MNVFISASPSGLTFLSLNSYLVKLGLFFLTYFYPRSNFSVQTSKETSTYFFSNFQKCIAINTYAQFYLESGPSSACSHTHQKLFHCSFSQMLGDWEGLYEKQQRFSKLETTSTIFPPQNTQFKSLSVANTTKAELVILTGLQGKTQGGRD